MEELTLKEKIEERLNERINYILNKNIEDITCEEFLVLSSKLKDIGYEETKDKRNKEYIELISKLFND